MVRRLVTIAAAVVLLTTVVARVATAGFAWAMIDCCCGEHAASDACGCPDCPAGAHVEAGHDDHGDGERIEACGLDARLLAPEPVIAVAPAPAPAPDLAQAIARPPPFARPPDGVPPPVPEPPPPRPIHASR